MVADMALRFSGRFKVIVAIGPAMSRISVENMILNPLSVHKRSMGVFCANFAGHFESFRQARGVDAGIGARLTQSRQHIFGSDVAHQIISGEGAAAKPSERAVKAAAPSFVGSKEFLLRMLRPAV